MSVATTAEIEASAVHAPGADLAPYMAQAMAEYRPRIVMAAEEAAEMDAQLRAMMRAVLKEDVDFGVIPGTGTKPTLLKPGAEKLLQWFGFGNTTERVETERDDDGKRIGVTYRCTVTKQMPDGRVVAVATCEGYAGYDEDRFYVTADAARAKAEAAERKWARKDRREPNSAKWENAAEYRAPWNSVIKMAQKRAMVGAALGATSASTLFTQDLEDTRDQDDGGQFTAAGSAALMALPPDVREGLDRWRQNRKWPEARQWSAEQWCSALQMAGFLVAKREKPQQAGPDGAGAKAPADAADEAARIPDAGEADPEAEWVLGFTARIPDAGETEIRNMRIEMAKAVQAKVIGHETALELGVLLKNRRDALETASAA
jgi:hypothetical protein